MLNIFEPSTLPIKAEPQKIRQLIQLKLSKVVDMAMRETNRGFANRVFLETFHGGYYKVACPV